MMIEPGTQVGSFRVVSQLGAGGMGVVFIAEHVTLERRVALKVLRHELGANPEAVSRFFTEAKAISRIGHEHIVDVIDFGTAPTGENYYVMELLQGESLSARLARQGPWELGQTLHVAIQVAQALEASHAARIVHRDLKPDNVLLISRHGDPNYVKLLDFGIAKLVDPKAGQGQQTREGAMLGTPYYMSPEQASGQPVDARADIYSLGVVLYQLITGVMPISGETLGELFAEALTGTVEPPSVHVPGLAPELDALILRCLAKKPAERVQTVAELAAGLAPFGSLGQSMPSMQAAAAAGRVAVTPGGAVGSVEGSTTLGKAAVSAQTGGGAPPRSGSKVWVAVGVLAVAGAGVAFAVTRSGTPAVSTAPSVSIAAAAAPPVVPSASIASTASVPASTAPAPATSAPAIPDAKIDASVAPVASASAAPSSAPAAKPGKPPVAPVASVSPAKPPAKPPTKPADPFGSPD